MTVKVLNLENVEGSVLALQCCFSFDPTGTATDEGTPGGVLNQSLKNRNKKHKIVTEVIQGQSQLESKPHSSGRYEPLPNCQQRYLEVATLQSQLTLVLYRSPTGFNRSKTRLECFFFSHKMTPTSRTIQVVIENWFETARPTQT